jgi:hypothetical protein
LQDGWKRVVHPDAATRRQAVAEDNDARCLLAAGGWRNGGSRKRNEKGFN